MRFLPPVLAAAALLAAPAAFLSTTAHAQGAPKVCKLEIAGNDMMQFDKKELKVAQGCAQVELTLKHTGKLPAQSMGHNWVLTRTADASAVASAGMTAQLQNNYVKPDDKRVIAHTKVVGGGQSTSIKFATSGLKKGESYTYMCTFPGHSTIMRGSFVIG